MESLLLLVVVLALSSMIRPCISAGVCPSPTHDFGGLCKKDGAFHFPVFHRKRPCLDASPIHKASMSNASTVIGNDRIHESKYFMSISLGTPSVNV